MNMTSSDFIIGLLEDQQSLSAVEQFSQYHDSGDTAVLDAEPAQAKYYRDLMPATPPDAESQYAFEVDLDACSGCKACVVACHTMNGLEEDESWRRVGVVTTTPPTETAELPIVRHVTTACHHCEDPGCLNGCPVKAYDKDPDTGIVRHLDDQCIGCKYCTMMCPYEVPRYSKRLGIVRKCDMCHQRLSAGEAPACVQSCPNEAIKIRLVPRTVEVGPGERLTTGAPVSSISRPTTRYTGADLTDPQISVPQDHHVDHPAESHWPLAVMLVATQISVGIVLVERLASLFAGESWATNVTPWTTLLAFAVGNAGLGIAPLHLGQPLRAWRVFLGLRTSWLSREAVILGKYMALLGGGLALAWMPLWKPYLPEFLTAMVPTWAMSVLTWSSVPVGVAGLYASAMIYIATRRQLWRQSRTLVRFFGTAIIGGLLGVGVVATLAWSSVVAASMLLTAAIILALKMVYENQILMNASVLVSPTDRYGQYDQRARKLVENDLQPLAKFRIAAGWGSVALIAIGVLTVAFAPAVAFVLGCVACATLLASELGERLLYFTSVVYDRMPGTLS